MSDNYLHVQGDSEEKIIEELQHNQHPDSVIRDTRQKSTKPQCSRSANTLSTHLARQKSMKPQHSTSLNTKSAQLKLSFKSNLTHQKVGKSSENTSSQLKLFMKMRIASRKPYVNPHSRNGVIATHYLHELSTDTTVDNSTRRYTSVCVTSYMYSTGTCSPPLLMSKPKNLRSKYSFFSASRLKCAFAPDSSLLGFQPEQHQEYFR